MVAGQGTPDQAPARMMAYRHPEAFAGIIDVLVENSIHYLLGQLKAGADVLQIHRHRDRRASAMLSPALVDRRLDAFSIDFQSHLRSGAPC